MVDFNCNICKQKAVQIVHGPKFEMCHNCFILISDRIPKIDFYGLTFYFDKGVKIGDKISATYDIEELQKKNIKAHSNDYTNPYRLMVNDVFEMKMGDRFYHNGREVEINQSLSDFIGEYVVYSAKMSGGGTGHGPHDVFPDGYHVVAVKLDLTDQYNTDGLKIHFYQSGCFTIINEDIVVKRKLNA